MLRKGVVAAAAAAAAALIAVPAEAAPDESLAMGRYIVVLEDGVAHPGMVARAQATGLGADIGHVYKHALSGYSAVLPTTQVAELRADPRVASVTPDRPVHAAAQTTPTGVDRIEGDLSSTVSGNGSGSVNVGVAVIDTGIDLQHTDLNVVGGTNCDLPILPPDDDNGHGTHVAGTIAAEDNGQDVVGMAPGARLYAVKVLNAAGVGFTSNVVCGIDWVAANAQALNIKVANMSLGGGGEDDGNCGRTNDDPEHTAICDAVAQGVTFAVAAGNDNANFNGFTPAAYDEVLTTTAIADFNGQPGGGAASTCRSDVDDTAASFSNFTTVGSADVGHTIAAPGTCILSTRSGGGTTTFSGTSMASPHMAGTAALCIAGPCAGMSPAQVIDKLRNDAAAQPASYGFTDDPRTPNGNRYYGHLAHAGGY